MAPRAKAFQQALTSSLALLSLITIGGVSSLDCFSCTYTGLSECTSAATCSGANDVCVKKVYKRFFLPDYYEKGCLDRVTCISLQNLNTDRYCDNSPSDCTYCCDSPQCNGAGKVDQRTWHTTNTVCFSLIAISVHLLSNRPPVDLTSHQRS